MNQKNFSLRWWLEVTSRRERASAPSRSASAASARPSISLAMLLMLMPLWVVLIPSALHANTITVTTLSDAQPVSTGYCSLREAITNANNPGGTDSSGGNCAIPGAGDTTAIINFGVTGTITLVGSGLPAIQNTLTIDGTGQTVTVDGSNGGSPVQILLVNSGATLTLNDLTIANGYSGTTGGGVYNDDGTLTITNCTFSGNSAGTRAGGIYNLGTLTVTNSFFSDNSASGGSGGAIFNDGTLAVTNSSFYGNAAVYGGGIVNYIFGTLTVIGSTFSRNSASTGYGGGVLNAGGLTVTNSTFFANSAPDGGGVYNDFFSTLTVTNSTFSGNSAQIEGGGIYSNGGAHGGTPTITNSILAKSTSGGNCFGRIKNGGYNISDDHTCRFASITAANGDKIGGGITDAHLALAPGLANNGGPTETIALKSRSYAIDAIPIALCPFTDQRGAPRPDPASPAETACDIGAFESGNLVWLEPPTLDFGTIAIGQSSQLPSAVTLNNQSGNEITITSTAIGPDFVVVSTTCSSVLNAGQSCSFLISFQPLGTVTTPELFQVFDSAPYSPQEVQLQGTTPS